MECSRFLDCLAADLGPLRAVVPIDLTAAVPTCPGLDRRRPDAPRRPGIPAQDRRPCARAPSHDPWQPKELAHEEPLELLDRAYATLLAEFAARKPEGSAGSWYTPDQTVGFLDPADGAGDGHPPHLTLSWHRPPSRRSRPIWPSTESTSCLSMAREQG